MGRWPSSSALSSQSLRRWPSWLYRSCSFLLPQGSCAPYAREGTRTFCIMYVFMVFSPSPVCVPIPRLYPTPHSRVNRAFFRGVRQGPYPPLTFFAVEYSVAIGGPATIPAPRARPADRIPPLHHPSCGGASGCRCAAPRTTAGGDRMYET